MLFRSPQETLDALLRSLPSLDTSPRRIWSSKAPSKNATAALSDSLSNLSLRGLVKVTPDRVYSLVVHPSTSMDLVFAGDKTGHIGLWDATEAGAVLRNGGVGSDGVVERSEGRKWFWEAHQRNAISALKFAPNNTAWVRRFLRLSIALLTILGVDRSTRALTTARFVARTLRRVLRRKSWMAMPSARRTSCTRSTSLRAATRSGVRPLSRQRFRRRAELVSLTASDHQGGLLHRDLREPIQTVR